MPPRVNGRLPLQRLGFVFLASTIGFGFPMLSWPTWPNFRPLLNVSADKRILLRAFSIATIEGLCLKMHVLRRCVSADSACFLTGPCGKAFTLQYCATSPFGMIASTFNIELLPRRCGIVLRERVDDHSGRKRRVWRPEGEVLHAAEAISRTGKMTCVLAVR